MTYASTARSREVIAEVMGATSITREQLYNIYSFISAFEKKALCCPISLLIFVAFIYIPREWLLSNKSKKEEHLITYNMNYISEKL